jgi:hypothetical protein
LQLLPPHLITGGKSCQVVYKCSVIKFIITTIIIIVIIMLMLRYTAKHFFYILPILAVWRHTTSQVGAFATVHHPKIPHSTV